MPYGDRTGPSGQGPMTGRGAGFCAGYSVPGYMNPAPGMGQAGSNFRPGFSGRGRGRRNWFNATGMPGWQRADMGMPAYGGASPQAGMPYPGQAGMPYPAAPMAPPTAEEEANFLSDEVKLMEERLAAARERIAELEKAGKQEKQKK